MTDESPFALGNRVAQHHHGGSTAWALPVDVPEAVSFSGSLATGADLGTSERQEQRFVARLLDRGTQERDRFEIAEWLENRGARLSFSTEDHRITFSGRALRAHVTDVLALAAELLAQPRFAEEEVEKVRRELDASVRQALADTGFLSGAVLSRHIYSPRHPGYREPLDEKARVLAAVERDALVRFHVRHVASQPVLLALAGDISGLDVDAMLAAFPATQAHSLSPLPPVRTAVQGRSRVEVADKPNLDVQMGHGLALTRRDADFLPLHVATYALGGNFSARLMQEVRDRQGLTYGIRAGMEHVDTEQQGHFAMRATFSTHDLDRGIAATRAVMETWVAEGLEDDELESVRETLLGTYDVGLSSTGALAARMLTRAEQGFTPAYLDTYRAELRAVTRAQVSAAIQRHARMNDLHVVSAGVHPGA